MIIPLVTAILAAQRATPHAVVDVRGQGGHRHMTDAEMRELIRENVQRAQFCIDDPTLDVDWYPQFAKRLLRDERKQRRRARMRRKRLHGWA